MVNAKVETYHVNTVKLHGEVRKAEVDTSVWKAKDGTEKESQKIIIKIDDDNEDRIVLFDRDISHLENYKKGETGTFTLRLDIAYEWGNKYTAEINVIEFTKD